MPWMVSRPRRSGSAESVRVSTTQFPSRFGIFQTAQHIQSLNITWYYRGIRKIVRFRNSIVVSSVACRRHFVDVSYKLSFRNIHLANLFNKYYAQCFSLQSLPCWARAAVVLVCALGRDRGRNQTLLSSSRKSGAVCSLFARNLDSVQKLSRQKRTPMTSD